MTAAETSFHREDASEQPPGSARDPVCGMTVDTRTAHRAEHAGADYFFCSAGCRDKFTAEPARYLAAPRSGTPDVAAANTGEVLWTCPMHPQIVRDAPGSCPICGMALEPRTVSAHPADDSELRDMTRRFWVSLALTLPLVAIAMADLLPGMPLKHALGPRTLVWLQL